MNLTVVITIWCVYPTILYALNIYNFYFVN